MPRAYETAGEAIDSAAELAEYDNEGKTVFKIATNTYVIMKYKRSDEKREGFTAAIGKDYLRGCREVEALKGRKDR